MRHDPRGVEKLIQDAQKEGKFDDLACKGQPLHVGFGDLASVANDVMRDNGVVPEWIELSREIEKLQSRQCDLVERYAQRREADRAELAGLLESWAPTAEQRRMGWRGVARRWWLGERSAGTRGVPTPPSVLERIETDRAAVLFQYAALVRAERKKVDRYNLVLAIGGRQMRRVRVEERLLAFQARFPILALVEQAGGWELQERVDAVASSLLAEPEETTPSRRARAPEQAEALTVLRHSARKPPPIG